MDFRYNAYIGLIVALFLFGSFGDIPVYAASTTTFQFPKNLQLHDIGPDVLLLQQFLNSQDFVVAQTGAGSPGNETNYFGTLTYKALVAFQATHSLPATGYSAP